MKLTHKIFLSLFFTAAAANAAVTLSGTALKNVNGVSAGDYAAFIVSTDGSAFDAASFSFAAGDDLGASSTYGPSFALIGTKLSQDVFGDVLVGSGFNFSLVSGVDTNDGFAIITFESSTSNVLAGDTYRIWTAADWDVSTDGQTESFNSQLIQLEAVSASSTGTVVPEPSAFAAFAGVMALGFVMVRRRG